MAEALCVLANTAGRQNPRDPWQREPEQPEAVRLCSGKPGAETPSPAFTAPIKARASLQGGQRQGFCTRGTPACSEQHLLCHCQTPQVSGSSVNRAAGASNTFTGAVVEALSFTAGFVQESQVGLILLC